MAYSRPWLLVLALSLGSLVAAASGCGSGHRHDHGAFNGTGAASGATPLFTNLGDHHFPITTSKPNAQRWFDQGIRLLYAFNLEEAKLSFEEAARQDPKCAMSWWGVALALGPNINVPRLPDQISEAVTAIGKATELAPNASPREQAYVAALAKRYSADPKADARAMDLAYSSAMHEVHDRYPADLDAATLYAESLMDLRPWQLWSLDYEAQPGTPEIVSLLESVLARNPNHPGANHYYIHAVEASGHPEKGLPAAERLHTLMPGAGHLVHMPFHIYLRLGRYEDAVKANEQAVAADREYLKLGRQNLYRMMYYPHNLQSLCAMLTMQGRSAAAIAASRELSEAVPPKMAQEMQMVEVFTPIHILTLARFGKWDEVLAEPQPPASLPYLVGCWHFARGLALAQKGQYAEAQAEHAALVASAGSIPPDAVESLNRGVDLLNLAVHNLAGEIAARRGNDDDAIRELTESVRLQDHLSYDEPPPWFYPVRHSLGAVLIDAEKYTDAEAVYRKDLEKYPENGWALLGLSESLRLQNKKAEADAARARFRKAWEKADVSLSSSRF